MAAFVPAWRSLDATHSVRLLSERPRGGRVVALCVAPGLAGRAEGARLAVGLVRRWTEGGLDVVLADGDLARPILHLTVGLANVKGLADLLLVGDDWQSLALATSVPGLRFIPAGGAAPPTSSREARERLADLCLAVPAGGSALVVYVPLGTMLAEWTLELCTDIVVLSGEGEDVAHLFAEDEDRIRAWIGPAPAPHRVREGALPSSRARELAAEPRRAAPPPSEAPAPPERGAREPPAEPPRQPRSATSRVEDRWAEAAAMLRASQQPAPSAPPAPPAPAQEPLPLWSPPPLEPPKATPPPPPPPPQRPPQRAPRARELQDPLAAPPIMMAEWDRFGDEEAAAQRAARRRAIALKILGGLGGVALLAGAFWIWDSTREMPPYEARSTALPRAVVPPPVAPAATPAPAAETGVSADSGQVVDTVRPATPAGVLETRAPHQRYSWSMAAMGSMERARGLVSQLRRRAPGETFVIAPIVSDGRTLYRVLGGLAADREELAGIREPLGQATGQPTGGWVVREAPLAFLLQDFADPEGASARVAELGRLGVPAYVLVVERDDGSSVHRVYAGAYANEAEAAPMKSLMESAGIHGAALVERRGRAGG